MKTKNTILRSLTITVILAVALISLLGVQAPQTAHAQDEVPPDTPVQSPILELPSEEQMRAAQLLLPEVEIQSIIGSDDRVQITETTNDPWQRIVSLYVIFRGDPNSGDTGPVGMLCSGFFIDSTTVITAGHCVYSRAHGGWPLTAMVTAAQNGATIPYPDVNPAPVQVVFTTTGWWVNNDPLFDYGAVKLYNGDLGNQVGWFDYAYFSDSYLNTYLSTPVHLAGYPTDKIVPLEEGCPDNFDSEGNPVPDGQPDYICSTLWYSSTPLTYIAPRLLNYEADTYNGQSGSPIWITDGSNIYVIGIHTYGIGAPCYTDFTHPENNCGVRITPEMAQSFLDWSSAQPITNCRLLTLTHTGSGADPVASYPNAAGCGPSEYTPYTRLILTAAPGPGYEISGWSGTANDASTSATNYVDLGDAPHTATVHYVPGPNLMLVGTYNNTDPKITYTGNWTLYAATGPTNNNLHYSTTIGSQATFIIDSNRFTLTYTGFTNRGTAEIYVDDALYTTLNQYNSTLAWQRTWTSGSLGPGSHAIRIVHKTGSVVDIDGITVLPPSDTIPPATITNLTANPGPTTGSVALAWTAPGDDDNTGTATRYLVRYAAAPIASESAWNAATPVTSGIPAPLPAGSSQSMTVSGLNPGGIYYFSIRAQDEDDNTSGLSNSPYTVASLPVPFAPGTYEDTDATLVYTGNWTTYAGAGPTNNTLHYSTTTGSEAAFSINGNRFTLTYTGFTNRGTAEIYVDGALYYTLNQYNSSLAWQRTWTSGILTGATPHAVRIVHKSGSIVDIDAVTVANVPPPGPLAPGTYNDDDTNLLYTGDWNTYTGTGPTNNTLRYSTTTNSEAAFSINGNRFSLTYTGNTNRGTAEIYVDGALYATLNQYNSTLAWQRTWTSGILPGATPHAIRIVHKSGAVVDIDGITVVSVPPPGPLAPGTYDNTDTNIIYTSGWTTYTGTGPTNNILHYSTTAGEEATFSINGNRFTLTYTGNTNRGTAEIYVDGALYATLNQYNSTLAWQRTWTSGILPGATPHAIRIVHKSGAVVDIDGITVVSVPPPGPLAPGTYDNTDTNIIYTSGWTTYTGTGPTNNILHYSTTAGEEATFSINGNRFTLTYTGNTNRGTAEIYVDGALYATLNQYNSTLTWQRTWTSGILPGATPHTVRIVHKSGTVVDIDGITVVSVPPPGPLAPGTYNEDDTNIVYTSGWTPYTASGPTNNTLLYSTTAGEEATFSINGNRFSLIYTGNTNRGTVEIYVDGALYATLNQYNSTLAWQRTWTSGVLTGATPHAIRIVHKSGSVVDIDGITVVSVPPPGPLAPGTYDNTDTNIIYTSGWTTYTGTGPTNNILHYSTTAGEEATFSINGNRFTLTYTGNTNRGTAEIYVDGALYATLNQYNSTLAWQRTWTSGILTGATPHTVRIVHKSGSVVDIDGITVFAP
jgi:V8-like Glu-specific endopeptidase